MFKRKPPGRLNPVRRLSHLFHGIAIVPGERACESARQLANQRFLSEDAPRLPLDSCHCLPECRCVYRHFSDRRTDVRREADMGLPIRLVAGEKRAGTGRRITDS